MSGSAPRAVLDTSVVVSALVFSGGAAGRLRDAWQRRLVLPLVSTATAQELLRMLACPPAATCTICRSCTWLPPAAPKLALAAVPARRTKAAAGRTAGARLGCRVLTLQAFLDGLGP